MGEFTTNKGNFPLCRENLPVQVEFTHVQVNLPIVWANTLQYK